MKKKILRLVGQNGGGGARVHVWQINKHLCSKQYDVITVIPSPTFHDEYTKEGVVDLFYKNSRGVFQFLYYSFKYSWGVDLIHSHLRNATVVGFLLSYLFRVKHVITVHTPLLSGGGWKNKLYKLLLKLAIKNADGVIFISEFIKLNTYQSLGLAEIEVNSFVIHNGSADFGGVKNKNNNIMIICMVGELSDRKGISDLLDIVNLVYANGFQEYIEFRLYGEGPWKERLINYGRQFDIVKVLGYQKDPYAIYSESSLNLMLGKDEAFGRTVTEAKSFGVPSLCWNAGAFPELVSSGVDGFLVSSASEALSVISKLLFDKDLLGWISNNARCDYQNRFSETVFVSKTECAVSEVLNK